jgi:hypothetical protein
MVRIFMIAAASAAILTLSTAAFAQQPGQYGSAEEAKAMLLRAVAAVKADKAKALDMFNSGPKRTRPARRLAWNSTPPGRSRKVKSLRLATCL